MCNLNFVEFTRIFLLPPGNEASNLLETSEGISPYGVSPHFLLLSSQLQQLGVKHTCLPFGMAIPSFQRGHTIISTWPMSTYLHIL